MRDKIQMDVYCTMVGLRNCSRQMAQLTKSASDCDTGRFFLPPLKVWLILSVRDRSTALRRVKRLELMAPAAADVSLGSVTISGISFLSIRQRPTILSSQVNSVHYN